MTQDQIGLIDIRLLRLFDAIHTAGSVTRASEMLGLAQPTVSIGLGRLRRHFGDPLFVRGTEGMLPTPFADSVIEAVRAALQALRQILESRSAFDPASSTRSFTIAMTDASHITLLPELLAAVWKVAPGIQLEATGINSQLPAALQSGEVDLALGLVLGLDAGFYQQTLFEQDWICIASRSHDRLAHGLSLAAYQGEAQHIGIISGTGQLLLEYALASQAITRRVAVRLPGFLGLSTILSNSELIATLPRHIGTTLGQLGGLAVHECPFRLSISSSSSIGVGGITRILQTAGSATFAPSYFFDSNPDIS